MSQIMVDEFVRASRKARQSVRIGKILLIDDDSVFGNLLKRLGSAVGEQVLQVKTIEEAQLELQRSPEDIKLVIFEIRVGRLGTDNLMYRCQELRIPCFIYTQYNMPKLYNNLLTVKKQAPIEELLKEIL